MTNNMSIWEKVCITDKDTTKPIEGKGFAGTSINPTSIYEKLTGLFGPCGIGWGYTVMDEYYREGHTDGENTTVLHVVKVGLWYYRESPEGATNSELEARRSAEIEAFGQTYFVRNTRSGWTTDEEAPKKSLTDAITKAASMLGVSADIYGGKWDGDKYGNKDKTTPAKSIKDTQGTACPECGKTDSVIKSKFKSGGYVCFLKKNGCGAKFGGTEPPKTPPKPKTETQEDVPIGDYPKDDSKIIDMKVAIEDKLKEDFPKVFWKDWVNDHCIKTYGQSKEGYIVEGYQYNVDYFSLERLEKVWAFINPSK